MPCYVSEGIVTQFQSYQCSQLIEWGKRPVIALLRRKEVKLTGKVGM
ncbi:MAG: hypothetical protein R3E08_12195 [Thiotrichaceae bacterium]